MTRPLRPAAAALVAVAALLGSFLTATPADADTTDLAVAITSPAAGASVSGTVNVGSSASTSNLGTDTPLSVALFVDGAASATDTVSCSGNNVCAAPALSWSTAGLIGSHSLVVQVTTLEGQSLDSAPVSVTANDPVVTIATPGAPLVGIGTINVSGSTPATSPDAPAKLELLVGASVASTFACTTNPCSHAMGYDVTGVSGSVTLTARLTTDGAPARIVTDATGATVSNPAPNVSITSPTGGQVVGPVSVAVTASTNGNLSDFPSTVAVVLNAATASPVALGTVTCTAGQHTCTGSVPWDPSGLSGAFTLDATLTTSDAVTRAATTRTVTVDSPLPTVAISDPVGGATVSGTVVVTADATTDGRLTELPSQVQLLVDGTIVDTQQCTSGTHDCPITLTWDATGVTGDHVLTTVVTTSLLRTATSAAVTVAVTTPPFDVAVTSPAASSVVVGAGATATSSGTVAVIVSASTDLGQNEFPQTVELLVDGTAVDSSPCLGNPEHACTATLHWDASSSAGLHRLAARLTTNRSHEATSASRSVFARSGSRVAFFAPPIAAYGGYTIVRGRVASTTSKQPLVGAAVRLVLVPAVGRARTVVVRTGVGGVFSIRTRYYANTVVSARVGASWLVKGTAVATQRVRAPITCSTARTTTLSGARGTGVCVVKNLPVGTVVRLRYLYRGRWATLANGRTTSTVIRFTYAFRPRGTYSLQVTVGTSRVYVATASRLMKVVIR